MVSAASRAAAKLSGGLGRNRPSRGMASSSSTAGGTAANSHSSASGGGGGGTSGAASFMDDVREQYESLSEKLARESQGTGNTDSLTNSGLSSGNQPSKAPRRVRWAETAAIASTMDGNANANHTHNPDGDDPDYLPRSPVEVLGDLFAKKYTVPTFLLATTAIFLMVHLAGGPGGDENGGYRSRQQGKGKEGNGEGGLVGRRGFKPLWGNRQQNVGGGDGFGDIIFSLSPSFADVSSSSSSGVPTVEVISHTTPKISPTSAGTPGAAFDGNEPGWILVPTKTGVFGGVALESDAGGATTLKYGEGVPSPDPATLDDGSKTTLKWNYGEGVPTPNPALLLKNDVDPDAGSPTTLVWNYPDGVPTPNPALLVEVAPPDDDKGSPTTLKWGGLAQLSKPAPTPVAVPAVEEPTSPDAGSPTTLKWNYGVGQPTPDPALLAGVPDTVVWGYPDGVPTPDPALLSGSGEIDEPMVWGYPEGVPTPDPALLTGGMPDVAPVGWGYPEGEPTPDPVYLNGIPPGTEAPTKRNVETGLALPKPTPPPTKQPTSEPVTPAPAVTVKVVDVTPEVPRPGNPAVPPHPASPPHPPKPSQPPIVPPPDYDGNGNEVEIAPPEPVPRQPRPPRPYRPPRPPPVPKVNTQPYNGPGGFTYPGGTGVNPDWTNPWFNGPNGFDIPGQQGQQPLVYQGNGGVVIPQQSGCGCCCCHCGFAAPGGGGFATGGGLPYQMGQGGFQGMLPMQAGAAMVSGSVAPTPTSMGPSCPWDCVIDETVPTQGRSNEDDALYEVFYTNPLNCCGTIVEVGAGDGVEHSPSYFFEKGMNWTAILTEADPIKYDKLKENRSGNKVTTVKGAYCKEGPELYFDEQSGVFKSVAEDDYTSEPMRELVISDSTPKVDCIRLDDVLTGLEHVNVIVVRVKGDPWAVLRTMDWDVQVDVWVILTEDGRGLLHSTMRAALKLHDYVRAAWDIRLWCDAPNDCMSNEVWLRKNFNPIRRPGALLMEDRNLRGFIGG